MAERINISPELSQSERNSESSRETNEKSQSKIETAKEKSERLEHIRGQIQHEAKNRAEVNNFDTKKETTEPEKRPPASKELKAVSLRKELKHVRSHLNPVDKLGSKVIHNPVVRSVSEVSGKTITRPSGLLGGGIVAFLGTGAYYYLTEHIGLKYNYLIFVMLFIVGFAIGLIIEMGIYSVSHRKSVK